ncbi:hypothetical protein ABZ446_36150 [Streptomyces sp. NPDC005813]|uniref:hypothetical protein n=1 Tax=Streptomyces sp. NPDC005813 TaxID=3155592 RepID=UPI0033DC4DBB
MSLKKFGEALAAGGKSMEHLSRGLGDAIASLGENLVKAQQIRHESARLREQQEFLARFHEEEARRREAAAEADFDRARRAAEHQAALDTAAAELAHGHSLEQQEHRARCQVLMHAELLRLNVDQASTPFSYSPDRVRADALAAGHDRQRPVLLIAPFYSDSADNSANDERPTEFLLALHHAWDRQPWSQDMGRLTGVFRRPLRMLDVDLRTTHQVLGDVPTVVVFGEIESNHRLWVNVVGWHLTPRTGGPDGSPARGIGDGCGPGDAFRLILPPIEIPQDGKLAGARDRVAFRDTVAADALLFAELYAEWFHTANGRTPTLHKQLPEAVAPLQNAMAVGSAAMLDIAVTHGRIEPLEASLRQVRVYVECGQREVALVTARRCAEELRSGDTTEVQLYLDWIRRTAALLRELGEDGEATAVTEAARRTAQDSILRRIIWGTE